MRPGTSDSLRSDPGEYGRLELRAHSLLADVPLHDVWAVDLAGGGPGRSVADVQRLLSPERLAETNAAVRFLFGLRALLGRAFGWDREPGPGGGASAPGSYVERLSDADRERSLVAPGTPEGPFRTLFRSSHESIAEIRNATVHAFSVMALEERASGHRLHWAVYVRPVGRITGWYMRLIDPFRRWIIYPAVLRHVQAAWAREFGPPAVRAP